MAKPREYSFLSFFFVKKTIFLKFIDIVKKILSDLEFFSDFVKGIRFSDFLTFFHFFLGFYRFLFNFHWIFLSFFWIFMIFFEELQVSLLSRLYLLVVVIISMLNIEMMMVRNGNGYDHDDNKSDVKVRLVRASKRYHNKDLWFYQLWICCKLWWLCWGWK